MKKITNNLKRGLLRAMTVAMVAGIAASANAVPAKQGVLNVEQPDGTTLRVRLTGDEWSHLYTTEDGYPLLYDDAAGYVYANVAADGVLTPSSIVAVNAERRTPAAQAFLSSVNKEYVKLQAPASRRNKGTRGIGLFDDTRYPVLGEQKALVILVEFQDVKFNSKNGSAYKYETIQDDYTAHDYFSEMLNKEGFDHFGGTGSVRDWFLFNSRDEEGNPQFIPTFDVFGPVTLSNRMSYYGGNDYSGSDKRPDEMVTEACEALDDEIDFSEYDRDGDGMVDNIYVFYAGYGEADGGGDNTIWPHSWDVRNGGQNVTLDGVRLGRYGCSNETSYTTKIPDGIGTFTHEFSHVMGLPDLYATSYTSSFTPGAYSVMDYGPYNNNGRTPPNYSAFERVALDWMTPRQFEYAEGDYVIPMLADTNVAYIVPCYKNGEINPNEYFLCEARQKVGNDKYIPGHGMLIWHVDYVKSVWDANRVNNTPAHQYVDLIEANGVRQEYARAGTPFPGSGNVTEYVFTDWKKKDCGVEFSNIEEVPAEPGKDGGNEGIQDPDEEDPGNLDDTDDTDESVAPGSIRLHAVNSNSTLMPEDPKHPAPVALEGEANEGESVTLTWKAPENLTPTGYKVYRDGEPLMEAPQTETQYVDEVGEGVYAYTVTAFYEDEVESVATRPLLIEVKKAESGVESIEVSRDRILGVYNLQGIRVGDSMESVTVPGMYMIRTTNGTVKIRK